ncbi:hypothetical protein NXS15_01305 [Mycoplasma sp. CSL7475-4]|uniref:hypothetical protein n=1 Tax=Mycoplasma sp. CSL7475-4 TaxID=2973942 RepID=UPI00216B5223|nr:hypothetical protein [Mycoplasma sp. CSL7475-4]MCS4536768.1 hypothetical protein [Mycoplasma sp. CSL7475-4]
MAQEKKLENLIKREFKKSGIEYFKTVGGEFQIKGMADLFVFHDFNTYALELKHDIFKNSPTSTQILQSKKYGEHVVWVFVDFNNVDYVMEQIKQNNINALKHYGKIQRLYFYEKIKNKGNK